MDFDKLKSAAEAELNEEVSEKAKIIVKRKLKELQSAKQMVKNIEREIEELAADINDGTFNPTTC